MANSGDSEPAQNAANTQNGEPATLPTTLGAAASLGPDGNATQPGESPSAASGDPPVKAPMPKPGSWPPRAPRPPADEDRKNVLPPPMTLKR